ncbi:molybdate ABC transporter substrate-binding protein [Thauera sp. CAU 1555]|uniref:Molybdate ABC transporter substrate-binding protein n=1 Tax=Thauera sedimentorum TaxID=2767595 RepID=A0ABR9BFL7_9RHOO|nr:molybdate ABC transporter substrate-binding protein [Thauera sedimentorum]MBC9073087.1 molybdate ABC transporter substrate-binding protein [Thauera sedimentorum]MBD8504006.1 molybdate ABC transporter substrate-binding protein [Thauera sedimentorum]
MKPVSRVLAVLAVAILPGLSAAAEIKVAVAANFNGTLQKLAAMYKAASGHTLVLSAGSSGALTTQIVNGAPFDVFLSADSARPEKLEADGLAVPGSRFVYALGVPVLWSASAGVVDDEGKVLREGSFRHLAIAEPRNAPYGAAAQQIMSTLGVWDALEAAGRVVKGNSIGQTHGQVASGAAELGFVALAQIKGADGIPGSHWIPPTDMYTPIAQAAVALKRADHPAAAADFLAWLRSDAAARKVIEDAGYGLE